MTYTISRVNTNFDEDITITITSKPPEGVEGINVQFRTETSNVTYSATTMVSLTTTNHVLHVFMFVIWYFVFAWNGLPVAVPTRLIYMYKGLSSRESIELTSAIPQKTYDSHKNTFFSPFTGDSLC